MTREQVIDEAVRRHARLWTLSCDDDDPSERAVMATIRRWPGYGVKTGKSEISIRRRESFLKHIRAEYRCIVEAQVV